jgi:hypothetical protein
MCVGLWDVTQATFAPICWSTKPGGDEYAGAWRHAGTGMMAFYVSDLGVLKPQGRIPLAEKISWGDEDYALLKVCMRCCFHGARRARGRDTVSLSTTALA